MLPMLFEAKLLKFIDGRREYSINQRGPKITGNYGRTNDNYVSCNRRATANEHRTKNGYNVDSVYTNVSSHLIWATCATSKKATKMVIMSGASLHSRVVEIRQWMPHRYMAGHPR